MIYKNIRNSDLSRQYDRQTWAQPSLLVFSYDMEGSGELVTDDIEFGLVFAGVPMFSYGVELQDGETLVAGDYPFVNCGVSEWLLGERSNENVQYVRGAKVYVGTYSVKRYKLTLKFMFDGVLYQNYRSG